MRAGFARRVEVEVQVVSEWRADLIWYARVSEEGQESEKFTMRDFLSKLRGQSYCNSE